MQESDLVGLVRRAARRAGRQLEAARREYRRGRIDGSLPTDGDDGARIVCRRYAEKRTVVVEDGKPECYESGHPSCESCAADVAEGVVETW